MLNNATRIRSDKLYVHLYYLLGRGLFLNWIAPKRYTAKLQKLKITINSNPELGKLVDKFHVREIIAQKLGPEYLNEYYAVVKSFEELDFDQLSYPCVIKTTHDSGAVRLVKEKPSDEVLAKMSSFFTSRLNSNYFYRGRESPYKYAHPQIIVEKFIENEGFDTPCDYKFFCFNGKVELLQVTLKKEGKQYVNYYSKTFDFIELQSGGYPNMIAFVLPNKINDIKNLAERLAQEFCHIRVDFYCINEQAIFGEYTFHSDSGLLRFSDDSWDYKLGKLITYE